MKQEHATELKVYSAKANGVVDVNNRGYGPE